MSKTRWLLGLGIVGVLSVTTSNVIAAEPNLSKVPPASDKKGLTFEKDIKPMLEASCFKCHGVDKPKAKYRMDSLAAVIKGGDSGEPAVVAGQSAKSPIVLFSSDAVEEMEMP